MLRRLKKKLIFIITIFTVILLLHWKFWNSEKAWLYYGNVVKNLDPELYAKFKDSQQANRMQWFDGIALDNSKSLHVASGWGYLSTAEYNQIVDDVLKNIPI